MLKQLFLFLFPSFLISFEISPWLSPLAEFELRPSYSYRYYPNIDHGYNPSSYSSKDALIDLNLGVSCWPNWDVQFQCDFSNTRKLSWGTNRLGLQVRHLILDDVSGSPISLVCGGQVFFVPTRNLSDPSSPYHAQGNLEVGVSIGKEIDQVFHWKYRFYSFLGAGIGNRGYPWIRPLISVAFNYQNRHRIEVFGEGYFGFGNRRIVNIRKLNGYGKIRHQSVDLALSYHYVFQIWGSLGVQCSHRIFARSFPKKTTIFTFEYSFPFSIF